MRFCLWMAVAMLCPTSAIAQPLQILPGRLFVDCGPDAKPLDNAENLAASDLARLAGSPAARDADLRAGRMAVQKAAELRRRLGAGELLEEPYKSAGFYMRLSQTTPSSRLAELFRRAAIDQFTRGHSTAGTSRTSWATGLSDNALTYAFRLIASDGCGVDQDNTKWLKADLEQNGWFTISAFGVEADNAAWSLVQHADRDRAFQEQVLEMLGALVASGDTSPKTYGYLFDRVAVGRGRPQRYGTQGRCVDAGGWEPLEIENPTGLDERRRQIGLGPIDEYRASTSRLCSPAGRPG